MPSPPYSRVPANILSRRFSKDVQYCKKDELQSFSDADFWYNSTSGRPPQSRFFLYTGRALHLVFNTHKFQASLVCFFFSCDPRLFQVSVVDRKYLASYNDSPFFPFHVLLQHVLSNLFSTSQYDFNSPLHSMDKI